MNVLNNYIFKKSVWRPFEDKYGSLSPVHKRDCSSNLHCD